MARNQWGIKFNSMSIWRQSWPRSPPVPRADRYRGGPPGVATRGAPPGTGGYIWQMLKISVKY